jgi:hypothetical protein
MKYNCFVFCVAAFSPLLALAESTSNRSEQISEPLPASVVMRINGQDVPGDLFKHEFRSMFYRYQGATNIRHVVFEPFYKRMLLAAQARELNLDKKAEVQEKINVRINAMKAFMDYQLRMAEIEIINDALITEMNLGTDPSTVTDAEMEDYFQKNIAPQPGAPPTLVEVPPDMIPMLKSRIAQFKLEQELEKYIHRWEQEMTIQVNSNLIDSVPFPKMKGDVPETISRP